jgi:hypothetical protein
LEENWKYNASKKIAQLTKVIYRLHCENTDRQQRMRVVRARCDDQIRDMIFRADELVRSQQQEFEKNKRSYHEAVMHEYNEQFMSIRSNFAATEAKHI